MANIDKLIDDLTRIAERDELVWNAPAEPDAIEELEDELGVKLPRDYRDCLEWHAGTDDYEFCSLEEARDIAEELLELWQDFVEDEGPDDLTAFNIEPGTGRVKDGDFVKGWVPFYAYGTGAFDLLDCNPGPNGVHGQVVHYDPDGKAGVTHESFAAWASAHAAD